LIAVGAKSNKLFQSLSYQALISRLRATGTNNLEEVVMIVVKLVRVVSGGQVRLSDRIIFHVPDDETTVIETLNSVGNLLYRWVYYIPLEGPLQPNPYQEGGTRKVYIGDPEGPDYEELVYYFWEDAEGSPESSKWLADRRRYQEFVWENHPDLRPDYSRPIG
jgi:hypothetical protein